LQPIAFLLLSLRDFAGWPKRKYSQGWEKSKLALNEITARSAFSFCIYMQNTEGILADKQGHVTGFNSLFQLN
jgi:hypothetical protein